MEPFLTLGVGYLIFRGLGAVLDDIDGRQQEKQAPRHTPLYTPPPAAPKKPPSYSLPVIDARKPTAPAYSNARELFRKEYVSFTRLDTFAKCRRKFSLVYLNGYRQESRDASSAARHGNRFHGMCEELFRRNEGKKIGHLIHEPEVQKDSRIRQIIESQHPDSIILAEELELSFRADDREFLGYVDLAVECPDGMVCLVDFKTGRQFKPPDPIQLDIYSVPELLLRPTRQVH